MIFLTFPSLFFHFGRFIGEAQRNLAIKYSLKKRDYLGNTSMEPEICFYQANLAKISKFDLVYDPFCGSGSNLISAAHFGALVIGSDLDYNILYSRGKSTRADQEEKYGTTLRKASITLRSEMTENYGIGDHLIGTFRTDFANSCFDTEKEEILDAIVSDPPYGVRELCKKVGKRKQRNEMNEHWAENELHGQGDYDPENDSRNCNKKSNWAAEISKMEDFQPNKNNKDDYMDLRIHYPQKIEYRMEQLFIDLIDFAAKKLKIGGRLTFWLPVSLSEINDHEIRHRDLKFFSKSIEPLSSKTGRQLYVFEKFQKFSGKSAIFESKFYQNTKNFKNLHMSSGQGRGDAGQKGQEKNQKKMKN